MGSQREENGSPARKEVNAWEISMPKAPVFNRNTAIVGESGWMRMASNPRGRVQKQRKGVTSRVVMGSSREILLKWNRASGAVARKAAPEMISPEMRK